MALILDKSPLLYAEFVSTAASSMILKKLAFHVEKIAFHVKNLDKVPWRRSLGKSICQADLRTEVINDIMQLRHLLTKVTFIQAN